MKSVSKVTTVMHSIRFRLVLWFAAILALVLAAFSAFVYFSQVRDISGEALYRLNSKMETINTALNTSPRPASVPLQEHDVFIWLDRDGSVLASQGIETGQDVQMLARDALHVANRRGKGGREELPNTWIDEWGRERKHYIFLVQSLDTGFAILGSPFDPYDLDRRLLITLLLGNGLTLAVALGGGWWLADRAMRPVRTITQAARMISETDLSRRLNLNSKDELGELARTFDAMIARLQAAFERQRQFLADASHELRTPLTIVNLEAGRALTGKRTPQEYQRALQTIRSENDFMSHLVNDLLTLARMDAGQTSMERLPLDLSDVALEALERLQPLAERRRVHMQVDELPEVMINGDRQLLLQMASNLIENGIKYTGGEARRVQVQTGQQSGYAYLRVTDTGTGIPTEHLPHLFERFYRVDQARTQDNQADQPGGSGLGLSIVQWIVQAHGGDVHVESQVGVGTVFEARFYQRP